MKETLNVDSKISNFNQVRDTFMSCLEELDIPLKTLMKFEVSLEELFVNVCHYAYDDFGPLECQLDTDNNKIDLTLIDSGKAFDPFAKADPDVHLAIEERPIGGLGIFMVKKNVDSYDYKYKDGKNIVHISFNY